MAGADALEHGKNVSFLTALEITAWIYTVKKSTKTDQKSCLPSSAALNKTVTSVTPGTNKTYYRHLGKQEAA